jgi:transposase-like protein
LGPRAHGAAKPRRAGRADARLRRASFRCASKRDWRELTKDLKPIYTAPSATAALDLFAEFSDMWGRRYPAVIRLWTDAWAEFVPFLDFDVELRKIICINHTIESVNVRMRRAVNARGASRTSRRP